MFVNDRKIVQKKFGFELMTDEKRKKNIRETFKHAWGQTQNNSGYGAVCMDWEKVLPEVGVRLALLKAAMVAIALFKLSLLDLLK